MTKRYASEYLAIIAFCLFLSGCGGANSDAGKLSQTFIQEKDGAEYLWLVIDAKDMYTGQYLADAIYFHAPKAIELAKKHDLKGSPVFEENTSSQGNIVFFVREPNVESEGWHRAVSVGELKRIRDLSFEDYDKNHAGNEIWNSDQTLPTDVRSVD